MKFSFFVLAVLALLASCATVDQTVAIAPLHTNFPVSASSSLIAEGKTIAADKASSSQSFEFKKQLKAKFTSKTADLNLADDLSKQVNDGNYSGVTQLKVDVTNVDNSVANWVVLEEYLGGLTGIIGGGALALSGASQGGSSLLIPGVIITSSSVALFGLAYYHAQVGTVDYSFDISGVKVKY